jgi:hypothetical protein
MVGRGTASSLNAGISPPWRRKAAEGCGGGRGESACAVAGFKRSMGMRRRRESCGGDGDGGGGGGTWSPALTSEPSQSAEWAWDGPAEPSSPGSHRWTRVMLKRLGRADSAALNLVPMMMTLDQSQRTIQYRKRIHSSILLYHAICFQLTKVNIVNQISCYILGTFLVTNSDI